MPANSPGSNTAVVLVSTSNSSQTVQLPLISANPGRIIFFKDIYSSTSPSRTITILTQLKNIISLLRVVVMNIY
mgnify:CR=1 FL=1